MTVSDGVLVGCLTLIGLAAAWVWVDQLPGVNLLLVLAVVLTAVVGLRRRQGGLNVVVLWPAVPALLLASLVAVRATPVLLWLPVLGCLSALAVLTAVTAGLLPWRLTGPLYGFVLFVNWLAGVARAVPVLGGWFAEPRQGNLSAGRPVLLGVALAAPLLAVFGGLFFWADALFARLAVDIVAGVDVATLALRGLVFLAVSWMAIGWLDLALADAARPFGVTTASRGPGRALGEPNDLAAGGGRVLGTVESSVVLGLLGRSSVPSSSSSCATCSSTSRRWATA